MKRRTKSIIAIITVCFMLTSLTGCDFFDGIIKKINGDEEEYTITKGYTYSGEEESTEVYYIHTATTDDGFRYKLYSSYAEITGYFGSMSSITVPEEIEGVPTTVIGENAFTDSSVSGVTVPDSVLEIASSAFYECESLTYITFGKNVKKIGRYAFFGCKGLVSVNFNSALEEIGDYSFNSCYSIKEIVLPDGLNSIGRHAFYLCKSLFKAFVPGTVTKLGSEAFNNCADGFRIYAPAESDAYFYAQNNSILCFECSSATESIYLSDTNTLPDASDISEDNEYSEGEQ